MQWDKNQAQTIDHSEYETMEQQEDKNKNNKD
jgi:hypothetical protein